MEHTATIVVEANSAELLTALLDAFDSDATVQAIHTELEDHPAIAHLDDSKWTWSKTPESEPEVYIQLGFRFFGAPMEELLDLSAQRRFEKPAQDWHEATLEEALEAMDDAVAVYDDPTEDEEEGDFSHYQIGNVSIEIG